MLKRRLCTAAGCNKIVEVDSNSNESPRCPKHTVAKTKRVFDRDEQYWKEQAVYRSNRWKKLRAYKINLNPLCEHCDRIGIIRPAEQVDHVIAMRNGGDPYPTDMTKLASLCIPCHARKTGSDIRKRNEKKKLNGFHSLSDF